MVREGRRSSNDELAALWKRYREMEVEYYGGAHPLVWFGFDLPDMHAIEAGLRRELDPGAIADRAERDALREALALYDDLPPPATKPRSVGDTKPPRHRPPDELSEDSVKMAKGLLAERRALEEAGKPSPPGLSYEAIGMAAGFGSAAASRARVKQIRDLIGIGWDPLRTHPDFSANEGFVRLPTLPEARRLQRLR
jgi:hypothetical protein